MKVDIDFVPVEHPIVHSIADDPQLTSLVDELYFECAATPEANPRSAPPTPPRAARRPSPHAGRLTAIDNRRVAFKRVVDMLWFADEREAGEHTEASDGLVDLCTGRLRENM